MMTRHSIYLLLSFLLFDCSNRHVTSQLQVTSIVTLCDQYSGKLNKADIIAKPFLTIHNNKLKWKIISYELWFIAHGQLKIHLLSTDTFSKESLDQFKAVQQGCQFSIDQIKAVNKYNDTCYLNPIVVRVQTK